MSEGYIGIAPTENSVDYETRVTYVATGGETVINAVYTVNYLDVFVNGVKQQVGVDFTATNGTSFTLAVAAIAGDVIEYNYKKASSPYDYYLKAEIDGFNAGKAALAGSASQTFSVAPATAPAHATRYDQDNIPTVGCTQATGGLTFTSASFPQTFRSTTLTSGTQLTLTAAPSNLVLPSGGTLGAVTTVQARIIVIEINNAGTKELAVINIAGGNDLSETGVINTTAISASSTANNVFYSTTARTGVAYRVVGAVDAINTAGAWASPVLVQGMGGNALSAMSSLGYGQKYYDMTASRVSGTTYYNTTGKPIFVTCATPSISSLLWTVNGVSITTITSIYFIVPVNGSYSILVPTGIYGNSWGELR